MHKRQIFLYSSNQDQAFSAVAPETSRGMKKGDDHESVQGISSNAMQFWVELAQELGRPCLQPKGELLMLADRMRQQPRQDPPRP